MNRLTTTVYLLMLVLPLAAQLNFVDIAEERGLDHRYLSALLGGGVSFYDFNQDGWDDITLATAQGDPIEFYLNMGGHFQALPALIDNEDEAKQVLWVDFDNDDDLDLFVATYDGLNRLYEQTGDLQFEDITLAAGLPSFNTRTYGACFGDYDRDGWLDLYFGIRIPFEPAHNRHYLFHNNGDGTFSNLTETTQTIDSSGLQFCSGFFDYNQDDWPDIYTAHDRMWNPNTLLENQGDGTFEDKSTAARADIAIDAMSVTVGDYNNDGLFDIYCTNIPDGSNLLLNQGPDPEGQYFFEEVAAQAGVGFYGTGWGAVFLDADNDCDLDLYVSGADAGSNAISAAFYLNENDGTFSQPDVGFVGDTTKSYNNAVGDFNQDGYPDIMVINTYPFYSQLWSSTPLEHHWVKVKLRGILSNRDGIGSRIECFANGQRQLRYTQCGNGFLGQNSGTEIIGLGQAEIVDSLLIHWPSGHIDRHYNLIINELYTITEGESTEGNILVDPDTGIDVINPVSETTEAILRLYPSPAHNELNISSEITVGRSLRIIKASGELMYSGKLNPHGLTQLDIHAFSAGLYYLLFTENQGHPRVIPWIKI